MCRFHMQVSRFHAETRRGLRCLTGTAVAFESSVEVLAKVADWYFMIAAPVLLTVIALRGTGLMRM